MPLEAQQKQITPEELAKSRLDKNDRTGVLLRQMPPEMKKQVGKELNGNPKAKDFYQQMKDVAGGFWDGWEKWVNGAVHGTGVVFDKAGTWIGETAAEAVHGKEGWLTDKLVGDTQWIRNGLDVTGKVLGETAAKIISTWEGKEVMNTTTTYWKERVKKVLAMSPEEQARLAGSGLSFVATAAVGAKGLDKLSKMGTMSREVSLGSSVVSRMADKSISETGKLWMEAMGGNRKPETPHAPTSAELKRAKPDASSVEANARLGDAERLAKAEEILGKMLTPEQRQAILDSHAHWNGTVYEYTPSELRKKAEMLADAGLDATERRKLMQEGIVGKPKQVDTLAVAKYPSKTPQEVATILKWEMEVITNPANNLDSVLANLWTEADRFAVESLNKKGNAWLEARLKNLSNIVEYVEKCDTYGLSPWDVLNGKVELKKRAGETLVEVVKWVQKHQNFIQSPKNWIDTNDLIHRLSNIKPPNTTTP